MSADRPKTNFFSRLNARARVGVLLAAIVVFGLIVYFITLYFSGSSRTTGPSDVASAPQGLQSVPGAELTPEYYRALMQANAQSAQQAQISGGSAVSTLVNVGSPGGQPCIICADQSANVKTFLDDWARQGKITPDVASELQQLADKNVSVEDYAAALDRLVKAGKLTPEQARQLLEQYKKQHANALLADSAKTMDSLIKSGQLPLGAANELLEAQKQKMSPSDYAALLQRMVREGKISPDVAKGLLAQYTQQRSKEIIMRSIAALQEMTRRGELTPDVLNELVPLENQMVPLDSMASTLQNLVTKGRLTPIVATKVLDEYKQQKDEIGSSATIDQLIKQAEAAAFQEISELLRDKKITPDVGALLTDMIQRNVSLDQYKATVAQLVSQNKLTPAIAQLKIGDYTKVKGLRDARDRLANLQANNVSPDEYANELKRAVAAGLISPEEAAQLMRDYQALRASPPTVLTAAPTATEFAALQQRVQQGGAVTTAPDVSPEQFAAAQTQAAQETAQDRQARLEAIMNAMSGQAQQLVASWQPPVQEVKMGSDTVVLRDGTLGTKADVTTTTTTTEADTGAPLIKAGTVLFAVLDTEANSDYPDSPIMATIVTGPYKGAKLMGKLITTKSVSGQLDRISLNFTLMNMDAWTKSKTVTAYAIDPDTARTVMASRVNYHYLQRFGAIMATSFIQGYANAITTSGSNTTTGIFGTSTTYPELSPKSKIAVGLGQVGQALGNVTQNYVNIPPTVRVDSGVGLGILFMSDVSA